MQIGILNKTFVRSSLDEVFAATKAHGFDHIQFNFACAGLPTLPESISPALIQQVRAGLACYSLSISAISGTCNVIHPDTAQRARELANLQTLIRTSPKLGTSLVTLCTGTRDPVDMWRSHPANHSAEAWRDLVTELEPLLRVAQESKVVLGVEPEPGNVIDSPSKARKLLKEMESRWLKIVFDAANILQPHPLETHTRVLTEAFDLLGADIVLAHAKDLLTAPHLTHVAAGRGVVDYRLYLFLLEKSGFEGSLILHSLQEDEVPTARAFLQQLLEKIQDSSIGNGDA